MIKKLYEKYMLERSNNPVLEDIAFEIFKEKISDSSLSRDLLHFVIDYEKQKGVGYLWVGHGTANPNARGFWNKYFKTYQYELVRKIEKY